MLDSRLIFIENDSLEQVHGDNWNGENTFLGIQVYVDSCLDVADPGTHERFIGGLKQGNAVKGKYLEMLPLLRQ